MTLRLRALAPLLLLMVSAAWAQPAPGTYHLAKTIPIGGPDRWDYVVFDQAQDRVYVAHAETVSVVDVKAGKLIGTVTVGGVTHGIATVPALGKGYTDDSKSGFAVVFDLKTLKELRRIKVEPDADGIVYDPASGHILVITGDSGKVSVIDPKSDKLVATIDGGGGLEFGVLGGNGKFYVDGEERNEIVRMDLASNTADAHWPLDGCKTPHGLAIDRAHMRLFASCGSKVMDVVNADTDGGDAHEKAAERWRKRWVEERLKEIGLERARRWGWPNTYSYSKSLGEQLVKSLLDVVTNTIDQLGDAPGIRLAGAGDGHRVGIVSVAVGSVQSP